MNGKVAAAAAALIVLGWQARSAPLLLAGAGVLAGVLVVARSRRTGARLGLRLGWWAAGAGAVLAVGGWRTGSMPLLLAGVGALAGAGWLAYSGGFGGTAGTLSRWQRRSRRRRGVASTGQILARSSWLTMRRRAVVLRPSLADLPRRRRWRVRAGEVALPLARVGLLRVWSPIEDVVLVVGGPRRGKSGWLAGRIIDAPGAVIATSTRVDLHTVTAGLRAGRGPVYVFNPGNVGSLPSTIGFDPLTGCRNPVTASDRAADMLAAAGGPAAAGSAEREFWVGQGRRVLAALLHAAALGGRSMADVLGWVANPAAATAEVTRLLRRSPAAAFTDDAVQFLTTNDRTRTSITSTVMPALGWLTNPAAVAATQAPTGFEVAALLRTRGTVYLLGGEEASTAPLVAALTGHIAREARRIAEDRGGRLDPPLTLALDEAALICPVPLDKWTSDMGGRGITLIIAVQSRAQLIAHFGPGAAAILNNAGSVLLFGGTTDADDLNHWSTLAGSWDEPVQTVSADGQVISWTVRQVPVLPPERIARLPRYRAVVFRPEMDVAVGRCQMAWTRRDVRAAARRDRRDTARVLRAAEAATRQPPPTPTADQPDQPDQPADRPHDRTEDA